MANDRSTKDKSMAAYLKKKGVKRETGMCPFGCGRTYRLGGDALINHLASCRGRSRRDKRIQRVDELA